MMQRTSRTTSAAVRSSSSSSRNVQILLLVLSSQASILLLLPHRSHGWMIQQTTTHHRITRQSSYYWSRRRTSDMTGLRYYHSSSRGGDSSSSSSSSYKPKPLPWEVVDDNNHYENTQQQLHYNEDYSPSPSSGGGGGDYNYDIQSRLVSSRPSYFEPSTLAKLAVAYSPPDRRISLRDVIDVNLLLLDGQHIELTAVIGCGDGDDDGQAVTVFVPIPFPHPSTSTFSSSHMSDDGLLQEEECILGNIRLLEQRADDLLINIENEINEERFTRDNPELSLDGVNDVYSIGGVVGINEATLPEWWVTPRGEALGEECLLMKNLLNEDGSVDELRLVAKKCLVDVGPVPSHVLSFDVEQAIVTEVGPAGLCLRARILMVQQVETGAISSTIEEERKVVELTWPFMNHDHHPAASPANDAEELRAAVLNALTVAIEADAEEEQRAATSTASAEVEETAQVLVEEEKEEFVVIPLPQRPSLSLSDDDTDAVDGGDTVYYEQPTEDTGNFLRYYTDHKLSFNLPSWWMKPTSSQMSDEADMLVQMLSDDETDRDVCNLASRAFVAAAMADNVIPYPHRVRRAIVGDIGSRGMCLRAEVCIDVNGVGDTISGDVVDEGSYRVVELTWRFADGQVENAEELRRAVLSSLSPDAVPYVEQEQDVVSATPDVIVTTAAEDEEENYISPAGAPVVVMDDVPIVEEEEAVVIALDSFPSAEESVVPTAELPLEEEEEEDVISQAVVDEEEVPSLSLVEAIEDTATEEIVGAPVVVMSEDEEEETVQEEELEEEVEEEAAVVVLEEEEESSVLSPTMVEEDVVVVVVEEDVPAVEETEEEEEEEPAILSKTPDKPPIDIAVGRVIPAASSTKLPLLGKPIAAETTTISTMEEDIEKWNEEFEKNVQFIIHRGNVLSRWCSIKLVQVLGGGEGGKK